MNRQQTLSLVVLCTVLAPGVVSQLRARAALEMVRRLDGRYEISCDCLFRPAVRAVGLDGSRVRDADLPLLNDLRQLECLDLHNTEISDAGLLSLVGHPSLQLIEVNEGRFRRETLQKFAPGVIAESPGAWYRPPAASTEQRGEPRNRAAANFAARGSNHRSRDQQRPPG